MIKRINIFVVMIYMIMILISNSSVAVGAEKVIENLESIQPNISDIPNLFFEVKDSNVSLDEELTINMSISNNNQNIEYIDLYLINIDNGYQYIISVRLFSTSELTFEGKLDIPVHREPGTYDVHSLHMYGSEKVLVATSEKYSDTYPYGEVRILPEELFSITGTYGYYIPEFDIKEIKTTYKTSEYISSLININSDIINYKYALMEFGNRKDGYKTRFSVQLDKVNLNSFFGELELNKELSLGYYDVLSISLTDSDLRTSMIYSTRYVDHEKFDIGKTVNLDEYSFNLISNMNESIQYRTHVQSFGWQSPVYDGELSGTTGLAKRLEGIEISIIGNENLEVKYTTHVEKYGWLDYVKNGEMSGTSGRALRLEAIKIELVGRDADLYDIFYRVHAESFGWLGWAINGQAAGTAGLARRLEAIEIIIINKGNHPGFETSDPFRSNQQIDNLTYSTHIQSLGWQDEKADGEMSGTQGESLRLEGVKIELGDHLPSGSISYSTHVERIGWMEPVMDGEVSGTTGKALRLEAIQIQLTGEIAKQYDVYYRVHTQKFGWLGWANNGQESGTAGYAYRLEALEVRLVNKNSEAPGSTINRFFSKGK